METQADGFARVSFHVDVTPEMVSWLLYCGTRGGGAAGVVAGPRAGGAPEGGDVKGKRGGDGGRRQKRSYRNVAERSETIFKKRDQRPTPTLLREQA